MKKLLILAATLIFFVSLAANVSVRYNDEDFVPNRIIIGFEWESIGNRECVLEHEITDGVVATGIASFDALSEQYEFIDLQQRIDFVKNLDWNDNGLYPRCIYNITFANSDNIENALEELMADPNIIFAEFEPVCKVDYIPNDASYDMQWAHQFIHSEQAWDYTTGSDEVVIGIVDSGIKWNHPDLQENIWINEPELNSTSGGNPMSINWTSGSVSGGNGIDDDGNGKVDDCIGWNFYGNQSNQSYQGYVDNDHGTHVAGCAGAVGDNYIGVTGPMMTVKLISSRHSPTNFGTTSVYGGDLGIYYCADSGADIINCSFGGAGGSYTYNNAVDYALNEGSIVVAAAGNDNMNIGTNPHYPGNATNAVCVAATGANSDIRANYSNYGTPVDVCAPGSAILSTIIDGNGYASFQGTSMASPIAAGVAGLIKSIHPTLTAQELKDRLENTCDDIDDLNPGYEGWLGNGRVNSFRGTMYDLIPNLSIIEVTALEQSGDGDGIPNPGETISLMVQLENEDNWQDASSITATLTCEVPEVTITTDQSTYPDIASGYNGWNSGDPFIFDTSTDINDYTIPFTLNISANPGATWPYEAQIEFEVELTLAQAGWPLVLGSVSTSSGVIIDLEDDGSREMIFGDHDGMLHVMQADGTPVAPFPVDTGANINVAIAAGNVDSDNIEDIVIGNDAGHLIAYDNGGDIIFDYDTGSSIKSNPMIADVDGDGSSEVIVCTFNPGMIHILNSDGTDFPNFPASVDAPILSSAAVGDLNGDGQMEVLVCTIAGSVNAISSNTGGNMSGWPYSIGFGSTNGPSIVNFDGDANPEVVIATTPGSVFAINHDGTLIWNVDAGEDVRSGIVTADFNNNGNNEICFIDQPGRVHIITQSGDYLPNFPVTVGSSSESTPVIVDMDNNGTPDVVFGDDAGDVHSIDITGSETFMFPINLGNPVKVPPAIGYADDDDDIEILVPNQSAYYLLDYKETSGAVHWANFKRNPQRTGNGFDATSAVDPELVPAFANELNKNYPNPFNPDTNISFSVKETGFVNLKVFNTRGQLVKTLISETLDEGVHFTNWNGKDNNNKSVSSGIYFYKMDTKNYTSTRKMILLK